MVRGVIARGTLDEALFGPGLCVEDDGDRYCPQCEERREFIARAFWRGVAAGRAAEILDIAEALCSKLGHIAGPAACAESRQAAADIAGNLRRAALAS